MNKLSTIYIVLLALFVLILVGCTNSDMTDSAEAHQAEKQEAVTFDSYLQRTTEGNGTTRTTYPATNGQMDNNKLKQSGFGVFAQYAGSTAWTSYTDKSTTPFNFMWNQQVGWNAGSTAWTYSPVKYWPNDNNPADNNGATGSQEHSYLNFFAYAPYVEVVPSTGALTPTAATASDDGIVAITTNATNAAGSYLTYRTSATAPFDPDENVDLLWAVQTDRYKTDAAGYGYVNGTVDLQFKHALALFTITVQGLFDHANNDDTSITYPDDRDMYSHILIESVDFSDSPLFKEGNMYMAPNPADATVPHWVVNSAIRQGITIGGLDINSSLSNSYLDGTMYKYWDEATPANGLLKDTDMDEDGDMDAEDALALYNLLPMGVSHEEVPLYYETDYYYMVLPNKEYRDDTPSDKMKVHMVYYVITYDERLSLVKAGYPKYFSIVKNDITATFDAFSFEPNKKYKLRLQPGLTSAKFEVTVVDGWDTPLTLDPIVVDWYSTPIEYNVE